MESSGRPPGEGGPQEEGDPPLPTWYRRPSDETRGEREQAAEIVEPAQDAGAPGAASAEEAAVDSPELGDRSAEIAAAEDSPEAMVHPGGDPPAEVAAEEPAGPIAGGLEATPPPTAAPAVADAWTTTPGPAPTPRWALHPRRDRPHQFGDRMATGVLLTLAGGSMIGGGVAALLVAGADISLTVRAAVCGGVALGLLIAAVLLRLVRGTEDLRGTLAVVGIAYAAACIVFAYNPDNPTTHDTLVRATLAAGVIAVLSWFAAIVVPSAVAGTIGVVALGTSVGAGIWLGIDQPTHIEVFVGAIGIGLAAALVLPRVSWLRPHPGGLGWALGGAALVVAVPAVFLMAVQDAVSMAAGATASAALLALAQRHRNLPAALGAFVGLAYLEALLIGNRSGTSTTTQQIIYVAIGVGLAIVATAAALLQGRARTTAPRRRSLPLGITELLLVAALALSVLTLFTANHDVQLSPTQLQPNTATTQQPAG